jgi:superfamily II DNA or RNA helicase
MTPACHKQNQGFLIVSALDLLSGNCTVGKELDIAVNEFVEQMDGSNDNINHPAILNLNFPFKLKPDQIDAVDAWLMSQCRGSIIYSSGTGKTEIAFECARKAAMIKSTNRFRIIILVPRIVLIEQNYRRLVRYGIQPDKIGRFFGEQKDIREITISTYQSAIAHPDILERGDMIVLDEVHLARAAIARPISKIFDIVSNCTIALLGLTATIDELDPKNQIIMATIPPVRKYQIKDAIRDGRLARPIIHPIRVNLTEQEQKSYNEYTQKIRTISTRFRRYDAKAMMDLAKHGGFPSWQARAWFLNVRKRKGLLASAENKLAAAVELIIAKHSNEKVMVFSETLESIRKLKQLLKSRGVDAFLIDNTMPSFRRQKILSEWGKRFYPLLSVHTLEIGYDVPEVAIEIILATTSNMNQIIQRVGRVVRKIEGKESASVYVIYVSGSRDDGTLASVKSAIDIPAAGG